MITKSSLKKWSKYKKTSMITMSNMINNKNKSIINSNTVIPIIDKSNTLIIMVINSNTMIIMIDTD